MNDFFNDTIMPLLLALFLFTAILPEHQQQQANQTTQTVQEVE